MNSANKRSSRQPVKVIQFDEGEVIESKLVPVGGNESEVLDTTGLSDSPFLGDAYLGVTDPPLFETELTATPVLAPKAETSSQITDPRQLNDPGYGAVQNKQEMTLQDLDEALDSVKADMRISRGDNGIAQMLRRRDWNGQEIRIFLDALRETPDEYGEFVRRVVKGKPLAAHLRTKGIDRREFLALYKPNARDYGEFYAGFLFGMLKAITYDQLAGIVDLLKLGIDVAEVDALLRRAIFDMQARRELTAKFESLCTVLQALWKKGIGGLLEEQIAEVGELLADGQSFRAGANVGGTLMNLGMLVQAFREVLPKLTKAAAQTKAATTILGQVKKLEPERYLERFRGLGGEIVWALENGEPWTAIDGTRLELSGKKVLATTKDGELIGAFELGAEGREGGEELWSIFEKIEDSSRKGNRPLPVENVPSPEDVQRAIEDLRGVRPEAFGLDGKPTDLQKILQEQAGRLKVDQEFSKLSSQRRGDVVHSWMQSIGKEIGLPPDSTVLDEPIAKLLDRNKLGSNPPTVEEFLQAKVSAGDQEAGKLLNQVDSEVLKYRLDRLKADFLYIDDAGFMQLYDYVPSPRLPHLAKTSLYFKILQEYGRKPIARARVGEIYYGGMEAVSRSRPSWPKGILSEENVFVAGGKSSWEQTAAKIRQYASEGKSSLYAKIEAKNKKNFTQHEFYRRLIEQEKIMLENQGRVRPKGQGR